MWDAGSIDELSFSYVGGLSASTSCVVTAAVESPFRQSGFGRDCGGNSEGSRPPKRPRKVPKTPHKEFIPLQETTPYTVTRQRESSPQLEQQLIWFSHSTQECFRRFRQL